MFAALNSFLTRAVTGYFLNKSLRFRSSASAYLNRTPATATNQKTWTISVWYKVGGIETGAVNANILNAGGDGSSVLIAGAGAFGATYNSRLLYREAAATLLYWPMVFRDPAAWYHIVFVMDTTQATAANRTKLYVNGVDQGAFTGTAVTQNSNTNVNSAAAHYINTFNGTYYHSDLEYAEYNFVDGQALAPTAFGASSIYNQWLPIKYAGTYGTNGFYLPFNSVSTSSFAGSFNGSTQRLITPSNAAFALGATSTTEMWLYATSSGTQRIISNYSATGFDVLILGGLLYVAGAGAGATATFPLNAWTHLAVVYNAGTLTIYFNGVSQALTGTTTGYNFTSTDPVYIGSSTSGTQFFNGSISNLRVVKGTAVYTANFTPSVVPLTAITNTSLLTLQNATIVDNSTNAFTITNTGTVVTSVQYPFTLAIAADSSGNGNNWTPNNISLTAGSTYDSLTDVPTLTSETVANYATGNPLYTNSTASWVPFSMINGNLSWGSAATNGNQVGVATMAMSGTNKTYWEVTIGTNFPSGYTRLGIALSTTSNISGNEGIFYRNDGAKSLNGSASAYGSSYTAGDIIGFAYDAAAGTLVCYKNNVSQGTLYSSGAGLSWVPAAACDNAGVGITYYNAYNFGQQPFTYTAPTGFLVLNTYNI